MIRTEQKISTEGEIMYRHLELLCYTTCLFIYFSYSFSLPRFLSGFAHGSAIPDLIQQQARKWRQWFYWTRIFISLNKKLALHKKVMQTGDLKTEQELFVFIFFFFFYLNTTLLIRVPITPNFLTFYRL